MHRVERIFQLLHVIAVAHVAGKLALAVVAHEKMIVGQLRRRAGAHIRPDYAAKLAYLVSRQANLVFEITVRRLAGLFQTSAVHIEHPAMITTANAAGFDPAVIERSAAMGTV